MMDRYFRTNKDSETGKRIASVLERVKMFDDKNRELSKKCGYKEYRHSTYHLRAIEAVCFDKDPDMDIWKIYESKKPHLFSLRKRCKNKNKKDLFNEINKGFEELRKLSINRQELNEAIGFRGFYRTGLYYAGFYISHPDYYLFTIDSKCEYDLPEGCYEITNMEYMAYVNKEVKNKYEQD